MNQDRGSPIQLIVGIFMVIGGLWHVAAPWLFGYSSIHSAVLSNVISGLAIAAVGVGILIFRGGLLLIWLGGLLGVWVMIAPEVLGVTRPWLAPLEASWGGPITIFLMIISALDRWFSRAPDAPAGLPRTV